MYHEPVGHGAHVKKTGLAWATLGMCMVHHDDARGASDQQNKFVGDASMDF